MVVRLPLAAQRRDQRSSDATANAGDLPLAAKTTAARRRVLVVDDVADIASSLALALELAGHEVRQAGDARQALAVVDGFAPDVVILDIGLPDMDGYALARALRERPATADARLIAVSGYGQEDDRDKSAAAGIDYHLAKPADLKELLGLIGG
jgi:CheY-like chemotaxis protein